MYKAERCGGKQTNSQLVASCLANLMHINENVLVLTPVLPIKTVFHDNWFRLTPKLLLPLEKAVVRANKASFSCFIGVVHTSYCNLAFQL